MGSSITVVLLGLISGYIPDVFPTTLLPEIRIVSLAAFLVVAVLFILFEIQKKSEDEIEFSQGQTGGKKSQTFFVCARYSAKERSWVKNSLKTRLKKSGMNARVVFALPLFDLPYAKNCIRMLQSGRVMLFVLTRRSFGIAFWKRLDFLVRKMNCESKLDQSILVLRIEKCRIPKTLRSNKVIDLFNEKDQESKWLTILQILRNMQKEDTQGTLENPKITVTTQRLELSDEELSKQWPALGKRSYTLNMIAELDKIYNSWLGKYPNDHVLSPDDFLLETHPRLFLNSVIDDMEDSEIIQIVDGYVSRLREQFADQT